MAPETDQTGASRPSRVRLVTGVVGIATGIVLLAGCAQAGQDRANGGHPADPAAANSAPAVPNKNPSTETTPSPSAQESTSAPDSDTGYGDRIDPETLAGNDPAEIADAFRITTDHADIPEAYSKLFVRDMDGIVHIGASKADLESYGINNNSGLDEINKYADTVSADSERAALNVMVGPDATWEDVISNNHAELVNYALTTTIQEPGKTYAVFDYRVNYVKSKLVSGDPHSTTSPFIVDITYHSMDNVNDTIINTVKTPPLKQVDSIHTARVHVQPSGTADGRTMLEATSLKVVL